MTAEDVARIYLWSYRQGFESTIKCLEHASKANPDEETFKKFLSTKVEEANAHRDRRERPSDST